jgi:hypothetical protein
VEGFRLSLVPSMGTNVLFTRRPLRTYSALDSTQASLMSGNAQPSFEYYDCAKWEQMLQGAIRRDFSSSTDDAEHDCDHMSPLTTRAVGIPGPNPNHQSAVVHLVVPDGTIQGTQLAHHLTSAMLCQNPALFHINAMQSVLASVLVYLLKQPFKSQAWLQRQLDWVAMSYSRAYATASCKGAVSEHERFKKYIKQLLDPETFRLCLISDALDHPRELKCPGLSKAILGMWMNAHPPCPSDNVPATLLRKWQLGLTAEMFHRLGLTLDIQV